MRNRKLGVLFGVLLICSLLYLTKHYQDLSLKSNVKHAFDQHRTKARIPTVMGHHATGFSDNDENCEQQFEIKRIALDSKNKWQRTLNSSDLFLYSAFPDNRLELKYIRITAMSKGKFRPPIWCRIWHENNESAIVKGVVQNMWLQSWDFAEGDQYYRPLLVSCAVSNTSSLLAVSLTREMCEEPSNLFWLNASKHGYKPTRDFAVCLKPLQFDQDITIRLLEWLELQILLGADTVSIYMYHLHPRTLELLESYEVSGWVTIKQYTLPNDEETKFRALLHQNVWQKRRHELLAYNDCFYRHIESHKYVINLDLDEAIIPLIHDSWKELLAYAFERNHRLSLSASMSAANVYFFDSFHDDNLQKVNQSPLHMLGHLYRSANFTPPGFAQKSFFSTNLTEIVSNHYALKSIHSNVRMTSAIERDLVQLHHYRTGCPPKMETECEENYMRFRVLDPVILKFKDRLIRNIGTKLKELNFTDVILKNEQT